MAATVTMPQLGESVAEGTILRWLKREGDTVAADESLCEIETEKVNAEMPSPYAGTLEKVLVQEGETVKVGVAICEMVTAEAGGAPPPSPANGARPAREAPPAVTPARREPPAAVAEGQPSTWPPSEIRHNGSADGDRSRRYSPAVMRLAGEHNVNLAQVHGTGAGGRITRKDVEAYVKVGPPSPAPEAETAVPREETAASADSPAPAAGTELLPLSPTRKTIGERMRRSVVEQPQAWMMVEADVTALARWRDSIKEEFRAREGVDLTFLPFVVKATVIGLKQFPILNSQWTPEGILLKRELNIGVAVATPEGLIVPVIKAADGLSVAGLAHQIADLAIKARNRRLAMADVSGGTFTVDNTGAFGSIASAPIINPPQAAILSSEMVVKRPVVMPDDSIAIRHMVNLCISFDHRVTDGSDVGGFMRAVRESLHSFDADTPLY
ncbi:MAG: 2-oxo acid dehydrogenase subunit E2 [Dehalococcoidia bacterium]|nr:2-oxo acid dehydrogenase subunit E2 [Dehalococcoidia bacterium]